MKRTPTLIDRVIEPSLKQVSRRSPYFTKKEVVHKVLARHDLAVAVADIRRSFVGYGLDQAILRYIDTEVGRALQQRDANGFRVYECYSIGGAERRWKRFRQMTGADLVAVIADQKRLRQQIDEKIGVYEAFVAELERRGPGASVGQVYDQVWRRLLRRGISVQAGAA